MEITPLKWADFDTSIFNTLHTENEQENIRLMVETGKFSLFIAENENSKCLIISAIDTNINMTRDYVIIYAEGKNVTDFMQYIEDKCDKQHIERIRFHSPHEASLQYAKMMDFKFSEYVFIKELK